MDTGSFGAVLPFPEQAAFSGVLAITTVCATRNRERRAS